MKKIRNKKTGQIIEVEETQLAKYGLKLPKAQAGWFDEDPMITEQSPQVNQDYPFMDDLFPQNQFDPALTASLQDYYKKKKGADPKFYLSGDEQTQLDNFRDSKKSPNPQLPRFNIQGDPYLTQASSLFNQGMKGIEDGNWLKAGASMDTATVKGIKGAANQIGTALLNPKILQMEAQNNRNSILADYQNPTPDENKGYSWQGRNSALTLEHGGQITDIDQLKSPRNEANVEVEKKNGTGEFVFFPNKKLGGNLSSGKPHTLGGTPLDTTKMNEGGYVLSSHLENPETGNVYAKDAKKFSTEKEMKFLDKNKNVLDKINLATNELVTNLKVEKQKEIFNKQESDVFSGVHGKKPILSRLKQDSSVSEYGGKLTDFQTGGKEKLDNDPSLRGTKKGVIQEFENLDEVYLNYKNNGYKGKKDITEMRRWAIQKDPQAVRNYILMTQPTNKHQRVWESDKTRTGKVNLMKMTDDELFAGYDDGLWDFRANKFVKEPSVLNFNKKQNRASDTVSPIGKSVISDGSGRGNFGNLSINAFLPDAYPRDPIWTKNLRPEYIDARYLDVNPELNEIARISRASGNDYQNQINAYDQTRKVFANQQRYNQQQDQTAQQFNAQAKMNIDAQNLGQFNRYNSDILKREGTITGQKKFDKNAAIENMNRMQNYDIARDWMSRTFNPSAYNTTAGALDVLFANNIIDKNTYDEWKKKTTVDNTGKTSTSITTTGKSNKYGGKLKVRPKGYKIK